VTTELLASVVITTYNRADALAVSLDALGRQTPLRSLTATPFGRYLDRLERSFDEAPKADLSRQGCER
jgi:hypothetical protein